jgi:hypothetical protein
MVGARRAGKPRAVENETNKASANLAPGLSFLPRPRMKKVSCLTNGDIKRTNHQRKEETWRKRANQGFTSRGFGCGDMIDSARSTVPPDRWRLKMRGSWERLEMEEKMGLRGRDEA